MMILFLHKVVKKYSLKLFQIDLYKKNYPLKYTFRDSFKNQKHQSLILFQNDYRTCIDSLFFS